MRAYEITEDINQKFQFYDEIQKQEWREKDDCTLVATSLLSGLDYQTVMDRMKKYKRVHGNTIGSVLELLVDFGFDYQEINPNYYLNKMNQLTKSNYKFLNKTIIRSNLEIFKDEPNPHNQLWCSKGHVFACKDGKVEDYEGEGRHEGNQIIYVYDVFPTGKDPRTDDLELIKFDRFDNYDMAIHEYARLYNNMVKEQYKLSFNDSKEIVDKLINSETMKEKSWRAISVEDEKLEDGQESKIIMLVVNDNHLDVYYHKRSNL